MAKISPAETIDIIMNVLISSYGNLGFIGFKLHSIKPNGKKDRYVAKYSFIPRGEEKQRIFYEARIDLKDKKLTEINEIKESDLENDD